MKSKDLQDHRKKALPEIEKILDEHYAKRRDLNFGSGAGKAKDMNEMRIIKKSIAQLLTIKKELEKTGQKT